MVMTASDTMKMTTQKNKLKSLIQDKSLPVTTQVTGSFLETFDLAQFRKSGVFAARACQSEMKRRKELSEGLLAPVFNADPKKVAEFLAKPNAKKEMVLAQTCYREGYQSKKLNNKFFVIRDWKNISALQAAALCLDKFLIIQLLAHIVSDDTLRLEAKKQLEEIENRIAKENEDLQEFVTATANGGSLSASTNNDKNIDRKEAHEKVKDASVDIAEYGAPLKALCKAYSDYLAQHAISSDADERYDLDKPWDIIGSCHKRLPRYILQEIFKNIRWTDDPDFSLEPPRGELRYWNNDLLDLDDLGDGSSIALYKSDQWQPDCGPWCMWGGDTSGFKIDLANLKHLYEVRIRDLRDIIRALQTPETALNLIAGDKSAGLKIPSTPSFN